PSGGGGGADGQVPERVHGRGGAAGYDHRRGGDLDDRGAREPVPSPQLLVVVDRRVGGSLRGVEADLTAPRLRGRGVRRGGSGDLGQCRGKRQHAGPADPEGDGLDAGLAEAGVRAVQGGVALFEGGRGGLDRRGVQRTAGDGGGDLGELHGVA